jgi:hypothetical protein
MGSVRRSRCRRALVVLALAVAPLLAGGAVQADTPVFDVRSAASGRWSDAATWQPARPPRDGDRVLIQPGHTVIYDAADDAVIRSIAVGGILSFARDRDTELNVGLVTIYGAGQALVPDDVDVGDAHAHHEPPPGGGGGALEVGTPAQPIPAPYTARIRLHAVKGMDESATPALVCRPGGRMDFHGAPLSRTWVKLGAPVRPGDISVRLSEAPQGWRIGDEVLVTGSLRDEAWDKLRRDPSHVGTEQRRIVALDGAVVTLDAPLAAEHYGSGSYRSEVANLSRSVIVESAAPDGVRGHTMYHRHSRGSISYARFAHLGKQNALGRYPIHFHRVADSMRGASVIGAAIVDSHNRWITIHGTEYLVVRDCIGFESVGHGFYLEDGSEVDNVLDRNLGIRAYAGKKLPHQALVYDRNDGAAFWWANGRNTLTRNVSCENERYGFRYESRTGGTFNSHMPVRGVDGTRTVIDIRTLPIYRFDRNESHTEALYSFSLTASDLLGGEGYPTRMPLDGPRDDGSHPHVLKHLAAWQTRYGLHPELPSMWIEDVAIDHAEYAVYRPWFDRQVYKDIRIAYSDEPFNRGLDDYSIQHGSITVDGLTVESRRTLQSIPVIQISDNNVSGRAESHFRNVAARDVPGEPQRVAAKPLVNRGGGTRPAPTTARGVPVYLHDFFAPGRTAKVQSIVAKDYRADGLSYREVDGVTGDESRLAEVTGVDFPILLTPRDDQPPATIITWPTVGIPVQATGGTLVVSGTSTDNGSVRRVTVNGVEAVPVDDNYLQWTATLRVEPGALTLTALSEDTAGNVERTPHVLVVEVR